MIPVLSCARNPGLGEDRAPCWSESPVAICLPAYAQHPGYILKAGSSHEGHMRINRIIVLETSEALHLLSRP